MLLFAGLGITGVLYASAVCLLILWAIAKWQRERNYPPGPAGIPILGYSVFLNPRFGKPHAKLRDLGRKYGDLFSFYIGSYLFVCPTEYTVAKELLTHPLALGRLEEAFDFIVGKAGFASMNGEDWQEQRKFSLYTMKNLGLGQGLWETMLQEGASELIEEIKSWNGKPKNPENQLSFLLSSMNVSLLFGRQLDKVKDKETIEKLRYCGREFMQYFVAVSVNMAFPWLRKFVEVFHLGGYDRFYFLLRQYAKVFEDEVDKRLKEPDTAVEDYINCYLKEMRRRDKESTKHTFTIECLVGNLIVLYTAGNDSATASVLWLFLLMAHHQDIQRKVHEEIESVVGREGIISYEDKSKFPYTLAVMNEMQRWITLAPLFPARCCLGEIKIRGYTIPKGAMIMTNMWAIMHDPRYFEDPDSFKPERFITDKGERITTLDGFAPFSIGKRNCPGEAIANMTVFIYFASIMQKFHVKTPPGKEVNFGSVSGADVMPKPQELCFTEL